MSSYSRRKKTCKLKKIRPLAHMYIILLTIVTLVYKGDNSMGLFHPLRPSLDIASYRKPCAR